MKIGYPCINRTINCKGNKTFRLKSYSKEKLIETVDNNLKCLNKVLAFNVKNKILFFRITSDLVPFASHPICEYNWQNHFKNNFKKIGNLIKNNNIRISMHPDQFIVLNSLDENVVNRSILELNYHAEVLDLMELDNTAKIQLHIGGAYGDKEKSLNRFCVNYKKLNNKVKKRLVIENDDKIYSYKNCSYIYNQIKIPLLFDVFHNKILNDGEAIKSILEHQKKTWQKNDGIPMIDYSSQKPNFRLGSHTENIDLNDFKEFLNDSKPHNFDIMLEIKDKEISALKAVKIANKDKRFFNIDS